MALQLNAGDTAWILACCSLVLLMTPALALFYGGMVRRKNVLSTLTLSYVFMALIGVQWVLYGYSLAFGADIEGLVGGLNYLGFAGVGALPNGDYSKTIPHGLFAAFQMMFAVITPALIIGAFVERIKFSGFLLFALLWTTFIYDPMAHWVWSPDGWLAKLGALDFAGGTVIHILAGISALVMAVMLGRREGLPNGHAPHNLPLAVLGAGFLWFGWFGFNAGSALAVGPVTVSAFLNTNTAAAAAGVTWMLLDWIENKVPTMLGVITGIVAGLVAITPAAGYVKPMAAIAIGASGSIVGFIFVTKIKARFKYDDSLDVFGVHGMAGITGAIMTGVFATKEINPAGADGLFYGNPSQLLVQSLAVLVAIVFAAAGTFIIFKIVDKTIGLRVDAKDEHIGLDLTQHHEAGYTVME